MIFLAVLEYAILALTFTIAKVAVGYADPLFLIGVRMIAAAPIMLVIHYWQSKTPFVLYKKDYLRFIAISIFHIAIPFIGEFWALQYVSSAKTAITYSLTPFIAAIFSYFLLRKRLSFKQILGLLIGLFGLMPLFFSGDDIAHVAGEFFRVSLPELVLLLSVTSASYAWFLVSDLMQRGYGISFINGIAMFVGGLVSMLLWLITYQGQTPIKGDGWSFLGWTALLILTSNVISYNLYGFLLRHISITFMGAIGFLCPIFASIFGVILLKENLGMSHVISLGLVCLGLWLFYREELKKN